MPKLKEPSSLQNIALDLLLERVLTNFDQLGDDCPPEKFREGLSAIKSDVFGLLPWYLVAGISKKFLDKFSSKVRPKWQYTVALEIVMDVEIEGLRCDGPILKHLDPKQGHRFRKLVELDLSSFKGELPLGLKKFHLNDLTEFVYPYNCTNSELKAVGRNCRKLRVLKLYSAYKVTNKGIRYLDPLRELRVLDIIGTKGVEYKGVNHLLSSHDKLEDFSYGQDQRKQTIVNEKDFLSNLDVSVQCPSIKRFSINSALVTNANLRSVVAKFPNLTHLAMTQSSVDDLSELRYLSKLESIELSLEPGDVESTWLKLKRLLSFIGANITSLKFICICEGVFLNQEGFDTVFEYCPNIKSLKLNHGLSNLSIPPFSKLTDLSLRVRKRPREGEIVDQLLEFPELPNLENLELYNFGLDAESVKSIVLDSGRFPVLKFLAISSLTVEETEEIQQVTRDKNLDIRVVNVTAAGSFELKNPKMRLRKELPSLQDSASASLLDHIVHRCDELNVHQSLDELRQIISDIKKDVFSRLPLCFLGQFSIRFYKQFCSKERPLDHCEAALEIIMDVDILGLRCDSPILECLDVQQAHRLRRLVEIDLTLFSDRDTVPTDFRLEKFHLTDVVTLTFPTHCTDRDLEIIGRECPKLEVLKVSSSERITDEGVRALESCRELRVVDLSGCPEVSQTCIDHHLLSVHEKLEDFSAECFFRSSPDPPTQFPSIRSFSVYSDLRISVADFRCIAVKFPNLIHFDGFAAYVEDMSALQSLNQLREIRLDFTRRYQWYEGSWHNLTGLLRIIGANITELSVTLPNQDALDFVFEFCPNIERLGFNFKLTKAIIPPFQKLKKLVGNAILIRGPTPLDIEFCRMLNLESLSLRNFAVDFSIIKSMMLDDKKFPQLTEFNVDGLSDQTVADIGRIAREHNLDFKITNNPLRSSNLLRFVY